MYLELSIVEFCSTWSLYLNDKESFFSCACRTGFGIEIVYLRLGLEPTWLGLRPSQNLAWDWNPHGWDLNPAKTHGTWFQDLMKLGFLTSHRRKNSVRDKVIGKKWIYSDTERRTLHRVWSIAEDECS